MLDNFIHLYNIPLSLLGLSFVSTGAAFTYYRIDLSYNQNERLLNQDKQVHYNSFKSDFLVVLAERNYRYQVINMPDTWLFNTLYPNARSGDQKLNPQFEEFILFEENGQGFTEAMNTLSEVLGSKNGSRYYAGSYQPLNNLFLWLKEIIALDADVNLGFMAGESFKADFAQQTIGITKDIFFIVSCVNVFEGWRFFDNKQLRLWRKNIDRLDLIRSEAGQLSEFLTKGHQGGWCQDLIRGDLDAFKKLNLNNEMPDALKHNKHAKQYILEQFIVNGSTSLLKEDAQEALSTALQIK